MNLCQIKIQKKIVLKVVIPPHQKLIIKAKKLSMKLSYKEIDLVLDSERLYKTHLHYRISLYSSFVLW
jgi:hypothetical protein